SFSVGAHPQLALLVEIGTQFLCVGAPQLALPVEIGTQFLYVGAPDFIFNKFVACVFFSVYCCQFNFVVA
ncbi:hypothetical protein LHK16_08625, partial [Staphylococcus argenteus]|nr:hypothetical protein [Staphylococcus argenteus]